MVAEITPPFVWSGSVAVVQLDAVSADLRCKEYPVLVAGQERTRELLTDSSCRVGEELLRETSSRKKENAVLGEKPSMPIITLETVPLTLKSNVAETCDQVVVRVLTATGLTKLVAENV